MILSELKGAVSAAALKVSDQQSFVDSLQVHMNQGEKLISVYVEGTPTTQPIGAFLSTSELMLSVYKEDHDSLQTEHDRLQAELDAFTQKKEADSE